MKRRREKGNLCRQDQHGEGAFLLSWLTRREASVDKPVNGSAVEALTIRSEANRKAFLTSSAEMIRRGKCRQLNIYALIAINYAFPSLIYGSLQISLIRFDIWNESSEAEAEQQSGGRKWILSLLARSRQQSERGLENISMFNSSLGGEGTTQKERNKNSLWLLRSFWGCGRLM